MYKKISIPLILLMMVFLVTNPVVATNIVKETLGLWYSRVLPSLFPTLILVNMILNSNIHMKHVKTFCVTTGILCGFPIGATTSLNYVKKGKISTEEGLLFASLFNQFSPSFLVSYVAIDCIKESPILVLIIIYGTQIFLFSIIRMLLRKKHFHYVPCEIHKNETFTTDVNYKVVDASILSSCEATMRICGYMVICNLINGIIYQIGNYEILSVILAPILEMTSGVAILTGSSLPESLKFALLFGAISFGGMSGLFQVHHIVKEAGVSLAKYTSIKVISFIVTGTVAYIYYTISH